MTYCYLGNSTKCSSPIPFAPSAPSSPSSSSSSPTPIFRVSHSRCTSLCTPPRRSLSPLPPFFSSFFFARAPFLFCFLVRCTLCSTGRGRQSAARFGRRCNRLRKTKTSSPEAVSVRCTRVSIFRRAGPIASMPPLGASIMSNREFSWKRVLQGFAS